MAEYPVCRREKMTRLDGCPHSHDGSVSTVPPIDSISYHRGQTDAALHRKDRHQPSHPARLPPSSFGLSLRVFFTIFLSFFSQPAQDCQHIPQGSHYELVIPEIQRPLLTKPAHHVPKLSSSIPCLVGTSPHQFGIGVC